jgi:hypothetical protein
MHLWADFPIYVIGHVIDAVVAAFLDVLHMSEKEIVVSTVLDRRELGKNALGGEE